MRGSTIASETLGAQQLKQQNGSYRVRDKQNELIRVARDLVRLGAEIMATEFDRKSLEDMAQMQLPTAAENKKKIKGYQDQARQELEALTQQAQEMATQAQQGGEEIDPEQAQQQFQQQQQSIVGKYSEMIQKCGEEVTIDAVMEFIGDNKMRPFALDIETDSTIYPDEMTEKASRQDFMTAFSGTMAAVMPLFQFGPEAVAVAGGVTKFALAPYRVGRELEGLIDDFVDQGPQIAERMQAATANGEGDDLAKANAALAEAEMVKAQAQVAKVQADTAAKGQQMQMDAQEQVRDMQMTVEKERAELQLSSAELQLKAREVAVKEREVAVKERESAISGDVAQADAMVRTGDAMGAIQAGGIDLASALAAALAPVLAAMQQGQAQQVSALATVMSAPKEVVRGPDGRAIGVRTIMQ
jgi:hypothetical protein